MNKRKSSLEKAINIFYFCFPFIITICIAFYGCDNNSNSTSTETKPQLPDGISSVERIDYEYQDYYYRFYDKKNNIVCYSHGARASTSISCVSLCQNK